MSSVLSYYSGKWISESGYSIEVQGINSKQASVSFFKPDGKPILRPFYNNQPSVFMLATHDDYEGMLDLELAEEDSGLTISLNVEPISLTDNPNDTSMSISFSWEVKNDFSEYINFFESECIFSRKNVEQSN